VQWYYDALKENEHFLSMAEDFSNLDALFHWAEANHAKVQAMIANANALALKVFAPSQVNLATLEAFVKAKAIASRVV